MTEIKFRMWDGKEKKYYYDIETVWSCLKQQKQGIYDHIADGCVFEQYTGKYDKNYKDIYDGDIVRCIKRTDESVQKVKVHYLNGSFMFGTWTLAEFLNKFIFIETIGNIHENPELLEVEND